MPLPNATSRPPADSLPGRGRNNSTAGFVDITRVDSERESLRLYHRPKKNFVKGLKYILVEPSATRLHAKSRKMIAEIGEELEEISKYPKQTGELEQTQAHNPFYEKMDAIQYTRQTHHKDWLSLSNDLRSFNALSIGFTSAGRGIHEEIKALHKDVQTLKKEFSRSTGIVFDRRKRRKPQSDLRSLKDDTEISYPDAYDILTHFEPESAESVLSHSPKESIYRTPLGSIREDSDDRSSVHTLQ